MAGFDHDIDAALSTEESIPKEKVLLWIDAATDLSTLSRLYRLTDQAYYRIQPDLGQEATCGLIQRYLLQCIRENVKGSDEIQDRWEAAQTLHVWFCHLAELESTSAILKKADSE